MSSFLGQQFYRSTLYEKKKENWFSLNGKGILSSFLGQQFYRFTLLKNKKENWFQ